MLSTFTRVEKKNSELSKPVSRQWVLRTASLLRFEAAAFVFTEKGWRAALGGYGQQDVKNKEGERFSLKTSAKTITLQQTTQNSAQVLGVIWTNCKDNHFTHVELAFIHHDGT